MLRTLIELAGVPALTGVATLAARRWGPRVGGVVSAFPAIVGPVLLIAALEHGPAFAGRAANGTLLGLAALNAFGVAYARTAAARGWWASLAAGWLCAAIAALAVGLLAGGAGPPSGLLVATVSLAVAYRGIPAAWSHRSSPPAPQAADDRPAPAPHAAAHRPASGQQPTHDRRPTAFATGDLAARMVLTAMLVVTLSAAAGALGPLVGGMLTALPVLASILAVFTHRQHGGPAAALLLRGAVAGMAGFVAFVEVVALLIVREGIGPAFAAATVAAVAVQALTARNPLGGPSRRLDQIPARRAASGSRTPRTDAAAQPTRA